VLAPHRFCVMVFSKEVDTDFTRLCHIQFESKLKVAKPWALTAKGRRLSQ
jgi:hypothetical protein